MPIANQCMMGFLGGLSSLLCQNSCLAAALVNCGQAFVFNVVSISILMLSFSISISYVIMSSKINKIVIAHIFFLIPIVIYVLNHNYIFSPKKNVDTS